MHLKVLVYHELPPIKTFCSFLHGNVMNKAIDSDAVFVALSTDRDTDPTEPPYLNLLDHLFSEPMSNQDSIITTQPHWQSWAVTDTGKRRKRNEDAILNKPEVGLWVVADGMGGHDAGDVASQLIVDTLATVSPSECLETAINSVKTSLCQINTQLIELAKQRNSHIIGSTVVVLAAVENRYAVLWAGDSRLYRLRDKQLQQLTRDHCPDYGLVSNEWTVKIANEITRAVGAGDELDLECEIDTLLEGDIFLLCSDGLDKELSLKEIEQIMLTHPHDEITNTLLKLTLQRGARDNVSIITICT
jgi:type VI secretion system protein ImpM